MSKTQKKYKGDDIDGDPWEMEISERLDLVGGPLVIQLEMIGDDGCGVGEAVHFYTPSQARGLAAALMAAADYVQALGGGE